MVKEADFLLMQESDKEKNSVTLHQMWRQETAICRLSGTNITEEENTLEFFCILKITLYNINTRIISYMHKKP